MRKHNPLAFLAAILGANPVARLPLSEPTMMWRQPRIRFSKRYPEQSSRQAMRGSRRAQGGPGIVLREGVYVARSA